MALKPEEKAKQKARQEAEWAKQRGEVPAPPPVSNEFVAEGCEQFAEPASEVKCDGDHGGPPCGDPECWNDAPEMPVSHPPSLPPLKITPKPKAPRKARSKKV